MDDERSIADRLAELQQIHDDGLITDDEFAERRTALLDALSTPPPSAPTPPPTPKSGTPGRWTAEEQAAYRAANPKRGMSTTAKVALGIAVVLGIVVLFNYLADDGTLDTSQTFANVAKVLPDGPSQLPASKTLSGDGEKNTASFPLAGDYTATMTSSADCYYAFDINKTSNGATQDRLGSHDGADTTATNIYAVPSGTYFLDVITGPSPSCPWTVTIKG